MSPSIVVAADLPEFRVPTDPGHPLAAICNASKKSAFVTPDRSPDGDRQTDVTILKRSMRHGTTGLFRRERALL
jgi:hypothetical protein